MCALHDSAPDGLETAELGAQTVWDPRQVLNADWEQKQSESATRHAAAAACRQPAAAAVAHPLVPLQHLAASLDSRLPFLITATAGLGGLLGLQELGGLGRGRLGCAGSGLRLLSCLRAGLLLIVVLDVRSAASGFDKAGPAASLPPHRF